MKDTEKCLIPGCDSTETYCRSLCRHCYLVVRFRVRKGETSWEEMEHLGLARAKNVSRQDVVLAAIEKRRVKAK